MNNIDTTSTSPTTATRISLKMLQRALKTLPPIHEAKPYDRAVVLVENRLDNLKASQLTAGPGTTDGVINHTPITCIASPYCSAVDNCWLEWEILLEELH